MRRLRGVKVPHHKETAGSVPVRMDPPQIAVYPMVQHIGAPAIPAVKPGDAVYVGTLLAEAGGAVSAPIYSGVSGTVAKAEDALLSDGRTVPAVVVKSDGQMTPDPTLTPPVVTDRDSFLAAVRESGVVGLGGAGFPTGVKLAVRDPAAVRQIVINGAECEPYITSDTRTMLDRTDELASGLRLLQKYIQPEKIIFAIEKNKRACVQAMREIAPEGVEVRALPTVYPQGAEKVLIYHTTGKVVPEGGLPIDVGVVVMNCTTLAAIARYIATGMPLTEKCITVAGSAVAEPKNVIAPIGTKVGDVFSFCGGFAKDPAKVLYGGPMMGISVPSLDVPVLKQTNALLAFDETDAAPPRVTACIGCGRCTNTCPFGLAPVAIAAANETGDMEALEKLHANLCMECGCCAFVCPARRPLVQQNKLAKAALIGWQRAKK